MSALILTQDGRIETVDIYASEAIALDRLKSIASEAEYGEAAGDVSPHLPAGLSNNLPAGALP